MSKHLVGPRGVASTESGEAARRTVLSVHGVGVAIAHQVPAVEAGAREWLAELEVNPASVSAEVSGAVRGYDHTEVMRSLSKTAVPIRAGAGVIEAYQEGERFWVVDDRWGMCELNLARGTWRSWVLPRPTLDAVRVVEQAVVWPMAQVLRPRGVWLVPAASVARESTDGAMAGMLVVSHVNLEAELRTLIEAGYRVMGQRWSALREVAGGGFELLAMPGRVEREATSRLQGEDAEGRWVDVVAECGGEAVADAVTCASVAVIEPARRAAAHVAEVTGQRAADVLRRAWPIVELQPLRAHGQVSLRLSRAARCAQVQLSRRPEDLLVMLETLRGPAAGSIVTAATAAGLSAVPRVRAEEERARVGVRIPPNVRWRPGARAG